MALIFVDGFDVYNGVGINTGLRAKWSTGDTAGMTMQAGRFGDQCLRSSNGSGGFPFVYRDLGANYSTLAFGCAVRIGTMPSGTFGPQIQFRDGATSQCGFMFQADGSIMAQRGGGDGNGGTSLGVTATGLILANTWYYIESEITVHNSTGAMKLFIDGVAVLTLTGLDNAGTANNYANQMRIGGNQSAGALNFEFDDIYVVDAATRLGERRVETLRPTADTAEKDFTRSAGSDNYPLVDELTTNGDTDYVQGSTVGDLDLYDFANLSSTPTTINAVQVSSFCCKTDATARSVALQVKSGATSSDGSNFTLSSSYTKIDRILATDPNTAAAWTAANVNAAQAGPKVTV